MTVNIVRRRVRKIKKLADAGAGQAAWEAEQQLYKDVLAVTRGGDPLGLSNEALKSLEILFVRPHDSSSSCSAQG